jgi:hypothetical protein
MSTTLSAAERLVAQGEALLAEALDRARQRWKERLVAAYALGSLAHGGFSAVSDVDLGLVLRDPLLAGDSNEAAGLVASVKGTNKPFADRLSVFWGSPASLAGTSSGGRFPPLDRLDLLKYGRLLLGDDLRSRFAPPTRKELVVAGAEFALWRLATEEVVGKLRDSEALARSDPKTLTKLVLYPVRFMFTAQTGEVGRNEAAVEHYLSAKGRSSALARLALACRAAEQVNPALAQPVIAAEVLPLYDEFLADHEGRLTEYGRADLAAAFADWRARLRA